MEASKSIAARVGHGREDVLEQGFGKFLGQHGDLRPGRTQLAEKLTPSSHHTLRKKKSKSSLIGRERPVKLRRRGEKKQNTRKQMTTLRRLDVTMQDMMEGKE